MIDQTFMIKKLKSLKEILVIFSQPTHMPFVECDPETFDDQVHVFADETEMQTFAKSYTEKKILLTAMKVPKEQTPGVYKSFYALGANAVIFHENGATARIMLEELEPAPDFEKLFKEKLPVINPTLQLSALYFLQEMYRPIEHDRKQAVDLEQEMIANLLRAKFILPLENKEDGKPFDPKTAKESSRIPYVKDKEGNLLLAVYSDFTEFKKFYREHTEQMGMAVLGFRDLPGHLVENAKGIVLNPGGFHLQMGREQLDLVLKKHQ